MTLRLHKTGIEFPDGSWQMTAGNGLPYRNLIINGDMRIDQRNAGGSVSANNTFAVDRLRNVFTSGGSFTAQQSTTAPDNFTNSVVWTVGSAASATASQVANVQYRLEGNTLSHLGFGTASAKTITLSFWVRSSVTGTYCAAFINSAADRAYVAEYTISSANTWEQKSITLTGDTTGTWLTTNGIGLRLQFDLGSGSDYNATANTWVGANDFRTTNQTDFINNAGATFYITGVQLEVNDEGIATPFEHRPWDVELQRCQRYYETSNDYGSVPTNGVYPMEYLGLSNYQDELNLRFRVPFKVEKRASCSMMFYGGADGKWQSMKPDATWGTIGGGTHVLLITNKEFHANCSDNPNQVQKVPVGQGRTIRGTWVASAEL